MRGDRRVAGLDQPRRGEKLLRRRVLAGLVGLGLTACVSATGGRPLPAALELAELEWLSADADRAGALTYQPAACLAPAPNDEVAADIRLGRMIFNAPALLGGQAEKKGLSCGSCHRNGRGNDDFQFEAISGAPGTADVTSGLFSTARADNAFNPVPIPDLARAEGRVRVDRSDRATLARFVRGQIEDEFSGRPAPDEIFEPLLTYLQFIDDRRADCAVDAVVETGWAQDWADARLAAGAIAGARSEQARAFYVRTARVSLGRIHDRYIGSEQADIRAELVAISRDLAAGGDWPETTDLQARLEAGQGGSLYNAQTAAAALGTGRP